MRSEDEKRTVWAASVVALALSVCAFSCGSGEAVATFASKSTTALHAGEAIYKDIPESYARGVCDRQDLTSNFKDPSPASACVTGEGPEREDLELARAERDGLLEISKILKDYFDALQQLAAFGTSGGSKKESARGGAAKAKAEMAAKKANFDGGEAGAAGQLAQLVATAFLSARLNRELERDLQDIDPAVQRVTQGLERVVGRDYERLLEQEAKALHNRYADAVRTQSTPAIRLLVYDSWRQQIGRVDERKAAAESYVRGLQQIREGHHKLVESSSKITAKSLGAALQPYVSQLSTLIPEIQKGF